MISVVIKEVKRKCQLVALTRGTKAYMDLAPSMKTGPVKALVITQPMSGGPEEQTGGDVTEGVHFLINWYDEQSDECWAALHDIEREFRGSRPVLADGTCMAAKIGPSQVYQDPTKTPEGRPVWHGVMNLTLTVQRSLTT